MMHTENPEGIVFDIQDYSIHDGPGIRTVVFLKGCPLSCRWCSNPESQRSAIELGFLEKFCRRCYGCIDECPHHVVSITENGKALTDLERCTGCGRCVEICRAGARKLFGRTMGVRAVLVEIERSRPFYTRSNGGVTISGGEPLLQYDFLYALLRECREKCIHAAVETCGFIRDREKLKCLIPLVDLFLYDIKCIDGEKHKRFTGVSNVEILENAGFLSAHGAAMFIRVPVIPGFNDSTEDMRKIGGFAQTLDSVQEVHLLPFHKLGGFKYDMLGRENPYAEVEKLPHERVLTLQSIFEEFGLPCRID